MYGRRKAEVGPLWHWAERLLAWAGPYINFLRVNVTSVGLRVVSDPFCGARKVNSIFRQGWVLRHGERGLVQSKVDFLFLGIALSVGHLGRPAILEEAKGRQQLLLIVIALNRSCRTIIVYIRVHDSDRLLIRDIVNGVRLCFV